jgi:hypothetical protein
MADDKRYLRNLLHISSPLLFYKVTFYINVQDDSSLHIYSNSLDCFFSSWKDSLLSPSTFLFYGADFQAIYSPTYIFLAAISLKNAGEREENLPPAECPAILTGDSHGG